jgi:hypothetical protein
MVAMDDDFVNRHHNLSEIFRNWLQSCVRKGRLSRNTLAVGMVVLNHLRQKCPVLESDVMSKGGELRGSRAGLGSLLEKYGIPRNFLKEVTTRQAHQDARKLLEMFNWGKEFGGVASADRDNLLAELITILTDKAKEWLSRPNLKFDVNRLESPTAWIHLILEKSKGISGGIVEQHIVGAKLQKRYADLPISNHPAHCADAQTERLGDFSIYKAVYHVTAAPSPAVIQKCYANIQAGKYPILLIPQEKKATAVAFAEQENLENKISIISIEDFVTVNIIEISSGETKDYFQILKEIIDIYNKRLSEVETDMSLRIEVR